MEIYADDPSDAPTMAKGSDDVFTIKTDTNPATDLKRTERHASRMNWNDNLVGSLDRRWVSMVDVSGVNEELLERLIAQTESEIGPPPEREPDIRWDHFKPLYPGGDSSELEDIRRLFLAAVLVYMSKSLAMCLYISVFSQPNRRYENCINPEA